MRDNLELVARPEEVQDAFMDKALVCRTSPESGKAGPVAPAELANRKRQRSPYRADPDWLQSQADRANVSKCDLYFIRMEVAERPIKIGRSTSTGKRFKMLQCGSPYKLTCLGPVYGEGSFEPTWHARFDAQRMFGEWFRPTPELEQAIGAAIREGSRVALGLPEPTNWRALLGLTRP